jgi:alpha-L-fucosidase
MKRHHLKSQTAQWLAVLTAAAAVFSPFPASIASNPAPPAPGSPAAEAHRWFQDAKFGLFIHWGLYSLLGEDAGVMDQDRLSAEQYQKLPPRFHPTKFDAEEWVKLAKSAGMKYLTITAKHHEGFCLFDSQLTRFDVVDATPYGRDPIKALAIACRKHHLKLFFYYSLLDWHHPDYFPRGITGGFTGRPESGDWKKYVAYYQGQVRELCTNYGEIGGIWFDGWWDRPEADWELDATYRMIHDLQPTALIGNNHHVAPFPGEDFQIFEQDLPGQNTAGFNKAAVAEELPLETCMTINRSWGYDARDDQFKSVEQLIRTLVGAAGRGANLLLNVGPRADGTIPAELTERLRQMGLWLQVYGESVYGTRRGPIPPQDWGVTTAREGPSPAIYLHLFFPKDRIPLPPFSSTYHAQAIGKTTPLRLEGSRQGMQLVVPEEVRTPVDTVIKLTPATPGP